MSNNSANILDIKNIEVRYDNVILALHDVSLQVPKGKVVALLGANGAGKSTTLKAVSTMLASERGKVTNGSIEYDGNAIEKQTPSQMVGLGMVQVLEGRRCFGHLTVEENIISGAYSRKLSKGDINQELEKIYTYFIRLKERRKSQAAFTSGGEQQMIAVARAMMAKPKMLLLDEPTMGLAPQLVAEIFNIVKELNTKEGVSILLAEQNTNVALLGANGAGKSTTLKAVSTMLASERGKVTNGSIEYDGNAIDKQTPSQMVGLGMVQVLEGRRCFGHLTVEENIISGAYSRKLSKGDINQELEKIYTYFIRLKERRKSQAAFTSGGEQQMIAVARAMMAKPKMLLLDEPTMGLAPQLVAEIFNIVKELNTKEGVSILLAEQNTNVALKNSDYGYIIETGRVMLDGTAESLLNDDKVKELYLGISKKGRKNFRDVLKEESLKKRSN